LGADLNDFVIADNYADPKAVWLTANDTTIYSLTNIDLGKSGPLVVDIPPGAIVGLIDDFWQRSISDVGLPGPDGPKGGKFLLLPPGYTGDTPKTGYFVVQATMNNNNIIGPRHRSERRPGRRRRERQEVQGLSAQREQPSQAEPVLLHVGEGLEHASTQGDGVLGASVDGHQQQPRSRARRVLHGDAQADPPTRRTTTSPST
jgi:hypothetical protein